MNDFSYFQLANTQTIRVLDTLEHLLDIAQEYCTNNNIKEENLLNSRLALDMFTFTQQVQLVADMSKRFNSRLIGADLDSVEDSETTISELKTRVIDTKKYIKNIAETQFANAAEVHVKLPYFEKPMSSQAFVLQFALPNIYFHLTTMYNIMRHNGIPIGKKDYLGVIDFI